MIKNIIFDLGNVLLNLRVSDNYEAIAHLLDPSKSTDFNELILYPFEKGEISEEAFFNRLQRRAKDILDIKAFYQAWIDMILDFPQERVNMLTELRINYRVFLLSNINITHLRHIKKEFQKNYGISEFENIYFDKVYYSFEIGMRKPDPEIFSYMLNDAEININESIFIDDNLLNVEAARSIGLKSHLHDPKSNLIKIVEKLLK